MKGKSKGRGGEEVRSTLYDCDYCCSPSHRGHRARRKRDLLIINVDSIASSRSNDDGMK